jgi:hypothetical protein
VPVQAPRPARTKPLPPALLQLVLRTLSKLTEAQPQHMAQQMTAGVLNTLLSLLDPSMQHLACKAYAAAIVMDCLCWACVTARYAVSPCAAFCWCCQHNTQCYYVPAQTPLHARLTSLAHSDSKATSTVC